MLRHFTIRYLFWFEEALLCISGILDYQIYVCTRYHIPYIPETQMGQMAFRPPLTNQNICQSTRAAWQQCWDTNYLNCICTEQMHLVDLFVCLFSTRICLDFPLTLQHVGVFVFLDWPSAEFFIPRRVAFHFPFSDFHSLFSISPPDLQQLLRAGTSSRLRLRGERFQFKQ